MMNNQPQRKPTRLKDYDYSTPGAYFVTVCTHNRKNLFGDIVSGDIFSAPQIILSSIGKIANDEILNIESHYKNVKIDKFVVMPNHIDYL